MKHPALSCMVAVGIVMWCATAGVLEVLAQRRIRIPSEVQPDIHEHDAEELGFDIEQVLRDAIPRDLVPPDYKQVVVENVSHSETLAVARATFKSPSGAPLYVDLLYLVEPPEGGGESSEVLFDIMTRRSGEVLSEDLGLGDRSAHFRSDQGWHAENDLERVQYLHQETVICGGGFGVKVRIENYDAPGTAYDLTTERAGRAIRRLASGTFQHVHVPPVMDEMVVQQRHLTRDLAQVRVSARIQYASIGEYGRGDILVTVRVARMSRDFDAHDNAVRREGDTLFVSEEFEIDKPGNYTVRVTVRDTRFKSGASGALDIAYEDFLKADLPVERPAAEIMEFTGDVRVGRINPTTSHAGLRVRTGGIVHAPQKPEVFRDLSLILPQGWSEDPYRNQPERTWETATSPFVYQGDKIMLSGGVKTQYIFHEGDLEIIQGLQSSVELEWEDGLRGLAIWDPDRANMNMSGRFVVGVSRETSGKWKETWKEWFGAGYNFLFEQAKGKAQEKGIDWIFQKLETDRPTLGGLARPVALLSNAWMLFNLTAGSTVYDDLIYIRLNSVVYIRSAADEIELFTLKGSPEILDPETRNTVVVKAGEKVVLKRGAKRLPKPRTFDPEELKKIPDLAAGQTIARGKEETSPIQVDESSPEKPERTPPPEGWMTHRGATGIELRAPKEFERFQVRGWSLALRTVNPEERGVKTVLATRRANPRGVSAQTFQKRAVTMEKRKHPSLTALETGQQWKGMPGVWFSYVYVRDGRDVKVLVYQHPSTNGAWEVRCSAPPAYFDLNECRRIIHSVTDTRR